MLNSTKSADPPLAQQILAGRDNDRPQAVGRGDCNRRRRRDHARSIEHAAQELQQTVLALANELAGERQLNAATVINQADRVKTRCSSDWRSAGEPRIMSGIV
ncbi:MAG: hypothetical protein JO007_21490 [Alphaproteobacteria bacterium]|nr:hypothetical protein [Alphaproteobacteria bacterium]